MAKPLSARTTNRRDNHNNQDLIALWCGRSGHGSRSRKSVKEGKRCKAKSQRSRLSSPFRIGISPLVDRHRVLGCEWGFHRDRDAYIDAEGGVAMRPHEKWSSSGSRAKFSTTRALVRVVWSCGAGASPRIKGWDRSRLPFAAT